jgi:hypothetical protein
MTGAEALPSVETLRSQLDHLLQRHGATARAMGHDDVRGQAFIAFAIMGRQVRMQIPMPRPSDWPDPTTYSWFHRHDYPEGWNGWNVHQRCEWVADQLETSTRARWRCLLELVTVKFAAIAMGLTSIEREFPDVGMQDDTVERRGHREAAAEPPQLAAWQAPAPAFGAHVEQGAAMVVKKVGWP